MSNTFIIELICWLYIYYFYAGKTIPALNVFN